MQLAVILNCTVRPYSCSTCGELDGQQRWGGPPGDRTPNPRITSARRWGARESVQVRRPWSGAWRPSRGRSRTDVNHQQRPPRWHHDRQGWRPGTDRGKGGGSAAATASREGADDCSHARQTATECFPGPLRLLPFTFIDCPGTRASARSKRVARMRPPPLRDSWAENSRGRQVARLGPGPFGQPRCIGAFSGHRDVVPLTC